jgi:hypothetical protein
MCSKITINIRVVKGLSVLGVITPKIWHVFRFRDEV